MPNVAAQKNFRLKSIKAAKRKLSSTSGTNAKVRSTGKGQMFTQTNASGKVFKVPRPATMRTARRNSKVA